MPYRERDLTLYTVPCSVCVCVCVCACVRAYVCACVYVCHCVCVCVLVVAYSNQTFYREFAGYKKGIYRSS